MLKKNEFSGWIFRDIMLHWHDRKMAANTLVTPMHSVPLGAIASHNVLTKLILQSSHYICMQFPSFMLMYVIFVVCS